jgi:hypothetical protein
MKGPYERLKYDLRRLWECPVCKRRERTAGTVTFRHCACQIQKLDGKPVVMTLVADGVQRLVPEIKPACELPASTPDVPAESQNTEAIQNQPPNTAD